MKDITLLDIDLNLFGEGGAEGGAEAGESAQPQTGETVIYGTNNTPDAVETEAPSAEDLEKEFNEAINGKYKDLYTKSTQKIIDRRFKETKGLEKTLKEYQPTIDLLYSKYGVENAADLQSAIENDDLMWEQAADEAGLSVDQYKKIQKLTAENRRYQEQSARAEQEQRAQAQLQQWNAEADEVRQAYPMFDINSEVQNGQFMNLIKAGIPMKHAYEVVHMDEIKTGIAEGVARQTEKNVTESIKSKGMRPAENATSSNASFTYKNDVSKLTKADRAEIARRVARGELISF